MSITTQDQRKAPATVADAVRDAVGTRRQKRATPAKASDRTESLKRGRTPREPDGHRPYNPDSRYPVQEAAWILRISVTLVWTMIRDGRINAIADGGEVKAGRVFVPGSEIARLCGAQADSKAAS
jgi:hypothetical protein